MACKEPPERVVPSVEAVAPPEPKAILGMHREPTPIAIELRTSEGVVRCLVDQARAPRAAAMVIGLATARASFRDPVTQLVTKRRYYDGLTFFRTIPGAMAQTGDPKNDGTGTPGYRLPVEARAGDRERLARPGALFLARYTLADGRTDPLPPPPGEVIGSQLVVSLVDMSHLADQVTVLGTCEDLATIRRLTDKPGAKLERLEVRE